MPELTTHGGAPEQYTDDLAAAIKSGSFESVAPSWLACSESSTTEPLSARAESESEFEPGARLERELDSNAFARPRARAGDPDATLTIAPLECPIVWARESNAFDCTVVFDFTTGEDLCSGTYFDNAIPVIDLQLAKRGFRLAAWLNVLFDGATNLP